MASKQPLELVIIGSGPAACSAALYAARDHKNPFVFERSAFGGTAAIISRIENYPGYSGTGADLMKQMRSQAESFGAKFNYGECTAISRNEDGIFSLTIDDEEVQARAVIVATGTERRKLNIPGENLPRISYCATCDGALAQGKNAIVIGGANSAAQNALYLLDFCDKITLLVRSHLKCDESLKARLEAEPRIKVITSFALDKITDEGEKLCVHAGEKDSISADYVFVFIGSCAATSFLPTELLDQDGSIRTNANLMTDWPGLFAAGDCRSGAVRQVITASGEGAIAAVSARKYLESQ